MHKLINAPWFRQWLAIVGTATVIIAGGYIMAQQSTRSAANELPLTMAQTIKHEFEAGAAPGDAIPPGESDLADDSIPFAIITDDNQKVLAGSAQLSGKTVLPPDSNFKNAKTSGSNELTWQPKKDVKLATRITYYSKDNSTRFIITGQSLAEPEKRIANFGSLAVIAWLVTIVWVTLALRLGVGPRHRL